jgi:hypothetical protein
MVVFSDILLGAGQKKGVNKKLNSIEIISSHKYKTKPDVAFQLEGVFMPSKVKLLT